MKITRQNLSEHLFEKQLEIIGKSVQDAVTERNWRGEWCMTHEEFGKFRQYAIPLIKKTFKCNRSKAISTFNWFLINFGVNQHFHKIK